MKRTTPRNGIIYSAILWILLSFTALFAGTAIQNTASATYEDAGGFMYTIQSQNVVTIVDDTYLLDISKSVEHSVYHPLDTVRYHIDLSNSGNVSVSSLTVIDTFLFLLTHNRLPCKTDRYSHGTSKIYKRVQVTVSI